MIRYYCWCCFGLWLWLECHSLGTTAKAGVGGVTALSPSTSTSPTQRSSPTSHTVSGRGAFPIKVNFTLPLDTERPLPQNPMEQWERLWNDKRSLVDVLKDNKNRQATMTSSTKPNEHGDDNDPPYCLVSDKFSVIVDSSDSATQDTTTLTFQVLFYPRGVYGGGSRPSSRTTGTSNSTFTLASAYLSFCPCTYTEDDPTTEVDVAWRLRLLEDKDDNDDDNSNDKTIIPILTSGGLPRSNTTWSAAMTFCNDQSALDSVGRTKDWGSSTWLLSADATKNNGPWCAELEMTIFDVRSQKAAAAAAASTSSGRPPLWGVWGDVYKANMVATPQQIWRAGQVIVVVPRNATERQWLMDKYGVYAGVDYRIMTMSTDDTTPLDGDNRETKELFTTESLEFAQRGQAQLALRPLGWKRATQVRPPPGQTSWPVQVPLKDIAPIAYSRVNPQATLPRLAAFATDIKALGLALVVALAPLATALVGREFVSLTAIPSASMEPTIRKGDVLLVEKLPNIYNRLHRGDVLLFRAPLALHEIIMQQGGGNNGGAETSTTATSTSTTIPPQQLFVKRLVGMPGDTEIAWQTDAQQVTIQGKPAVGPPRNLCDDEPLRLIDAFLQKGRGTDIAKLEADETYVLGDCQAVSIDSRVFGPLPKENIVGRPVARVWPLNRFSLGTPK